jgi:dolichol-phosphate mannosyltransferase
MTGLREAGEHADCLIVLDPAQNYHPDDLPRLIEPLARGTAEIAVACRSASGPNGRDRRLIAGAVGKVTRPLVGASDLFSGLVAISATQAGEVSRAFHPVGSRFTVDLLFRSKGRRVEVPIRVEGPSSPVPLTLDDLRHLKRLADDRFGNASRLIQFCAVGASGMVVDLSSYALFQLVFSRTVLARGRAPLVGGPLDLAAAGALAIALALTWNFSLNRRLTFNYARGGSLLRQYMTYALSNALGIALSFSLRLYLPAHFGFFHDHRLAAAVVGIVTATGISFSMSRWLVFRSRTPTSSHPHNSKDLRASSKVIVGPTSAR